ncbi:hypothetical protein GCM10027589_43280 [Actinocorallia lasiicapitis]
MLGLGLAACGGDGGAAPTGKETAAVSDGVKFARCMRENGVPMEDPKPGNTLTIGADAGDPKATKAFEACKRFAPVPQGGDFKRSPQELAALAKYAKCMREHGIDMPDPRADGGPSAAMKDGDMPKVEAASKACAGLLPGGE